MPQRGPDFGALWDAVERHQGAAHARARHAPAVRRRRCRRSRNCFAGSPSARIEHVEEAGHSVQGDQPIELARLIDDFVTGGG